MTDDEFSLTKCTKKYYGIIIFWIWNHANAIFLDHYAYLLAFEVSATRKMH